MMKHIWICAICLLGAPLAAETIGNVEFQFPPSRYEWNLLVDESSFDQYVESFVDEDDFDDEDLAQKWVADEDENFDDEEESVSEFHYKIFTHREGDALEIFVAHQSIDSDDKFDDLEDDHYYNLETAQQDLNSTINRIFPNHKIILQACDENETGGFVEWELNDGTQNLMHGYTRAIVVNENGVPRVTFLSYLTTARTTEHNRIMWAEVLSQVRFIE